MPQTLQEGATGTAKDGTRVIVRNGKWEPINPAGGMDDARPDQDRLTAMRNEADAYEFAARRAREFGEINQRKPTGGIAGLNVPFLGAGINDLLKPFDKDLQAMSAITSDVVPQRRPPGSGSSSDKDVAMYKGSFPNIDNTGPGNQKIREGIEREAAARRARANFYDDYYAQNKTLLGADKAWTAKQQVQQKPTAPRRPVVTVRTGSGQAVVRPLD